ncbi:hypothetical protein N1F89_07015 [Aquibium sp. A9E412]|uniref:hypothetical protein n=1 Tax=Aquibium sp. A9E412 TaxID=2976767 RepID=UPI0025AFFB2B|nr:hypothetical protein [Aquibium sp. A9E412]MDN2565966.1 hypothetical protein [Aquibium sp. A9E412]
MAGAAGRDFAAMLDDLLEDAEVPEDGARLTVSLDYLAVVEELHSGRISIGDEAAAYAEAGAGEAPRATEPAGADASPPPPLPPIEPEAVAAELGLSGRKVPADLDRLRRDFAFANHPDRVPEALRARAMIRMQIANMLIDEARRGRPRRRG